MSWNYDCEEKVLRIKDGVKSINKEMFEQDFFEGVYCEEEDFKVIIPNSVVQLEQNCFEYMDTSEYQIPETVKDIHLGAFSLNECLKSIQWPSSVKVISEHVFLGCTSLEKVVLPEGLEEIGISAFLGCEKLSKIVIPTTVIYIGKDAFLNCTSLKGISVPGNVKRIKRKTFAFCHSLEMVELQEGLFEIEEAAFAWCTKLTTIKIPTTVGIFGRVVFRNCENLKEIYVPQALYDEYGKNYIKSNTSAEVIPYNEPMVKNAITNPKARKENAENARITSSSKKEFKSFCGTIRTNLIADKRKK